MNKKARTEKGDVTLSPQNLGVICVKLRQYVICFFSLFLISCSAHPIVHTEIFTILDEELMRDRDALKETIERIDDGIGLEYTTEELHQMSTDSKNQEYKHVLLSFVSHSLQLEVETFETISQIENTRVMLVTTKDHRAMKLHMEKRPDLANIWLVNVFFPY